MVKKPHRPLPSFQLDGQIAAVTGASQGIGQSIAQAYASAGAHVVLIGRRLDPLLATRRSIEAEGGRASVYQADVATAPDVLRSLAETIRLDVGATTILVNAAGVPLTKAALEVQESEWDAVHTTNLKALFFCCQAFASEMAAGGRGKIINLSSTYASSTGPGKSVYACTKAGVSSLTASLAAEWASLGINVNALAPTTTITPSRQGILEDQNLTTRLLSRIPLGRFAEPADIVGAALFLASSASDFVTGHTLYVDGGWHARG